MSRELQYRGLRRAEAYWGFRPITITMTLGLFSASSFGPADATIPAELSSFERTAAARPTSDALLGAYAIYTPGLAFRETPAIGSPTFAPIGSTRTHLPKVRALSSSIHKPCTSIPAGGISAEYSWPSNAATCSANRACCSSESFLGALNLANCKFSSAICRLASAVRALASEICFPASSLYVSNAAALSRTACLWSFMTVHVATPTKTAASAAAISEATSAVSQDSRSKPNIRLTGFEKFALLVCGGAMATMFGFAIWVVVDFWRKR